MNPRMRHSGLLFAIRGFMHTVRYEGVRADELSAVSRSLMR